MNGQVVNQAAVGLLAIFDFLAAREKNKAKLMAIKMGQDLLNDILKVEEETEALLDALREDVR